MNNDLICKRKPWDLGTWLWLLNRIAGVVVILYLVTHICVISTTQKGAETFNGIMGSLHSPGALAMELLLIFAVVAHGLIGLRHILIDFGIAVPGNHKALFGAATVIFAVIAAVAINIMWPAIGSVH